MGWRLRIYDAFRPIEAQWALWRAAPGSPYVADPRKGGPHTRGVALDLTLLDGAGIPLDMGGKRIGSAQQLPKPGEDSRAVLERLGYDAARIDALIEQGHVGETT